MKLLHVLAIITLVSGSTPLAAADKPNVLFLFTDDQRADTIAALGNTVIKTPNLDALAQRGFAFRNAYCMGSTMPAVCNPSRHMVLSGLSLYRYNPKKSAGTFAPIMKQAGYVTWHLGKRGNTATEYHKAFDHSGYLNDQQERTSGHHGRAAADKAIGFLEKDWDKTSPFFMYLAFEGPHDPRVAAEEWQKLYERDKVPLPGNFQPHHPFNNGELFVRDEKLAPWPRTEAVVRQHLHDYYACISSLDHHIGRIIGKLKELKQLDNTIVIFSSDHGLALGSHGLFGKQSLYEHSMKAPLIFAGPGIPKGSSAALVYLFDVFPTVADLAGARVPDGLDGKSLVPVIKGQQDGVRDTLFLSYRDVMRAVRQGDWKLIRYPQVNVTQLFNLRDDPDELKNLADVPEQKERVRALMDLLAAEQKRYGDKQPLSVAQPVPAKVELKHFEDAAKKK